MPSTNDLVTDFGTHRIEGLARAAQERGLPAHFSVPIISHVDGNLWQGGCIGGVALPDDFRHVVSLYPWEKYTLPDDCKRVEIRMFDSPDQDTGEVMVLCNDAFERWLLGLDAT